MRALRFIALLFFASTVILGNAFAQTYPTKSILIVTSSPGGSSDFTTRIISQGISGPLGQTVVVENFASNLIGEMVAKAQPDGYTLLLTGGTIPILPLLQKVNYDPIRDFVPVTLASSQPNMLVVHPSLPVKSVSELIALAKAKPGTLNFASAGTGSSIHLSSELFKSMAGIDVLNVNYKGGVPAVTAMLSGDEVQFMFPTPPIASAHIKSGRLKALAVTTLQPSPLTPGLPTMAASGLPGYESVSYDIVYAPAKTPMPIVNRLNQEIVRVLNQPDVVEKHLNLGTDVVTSSPERAAALIKSEIAKWGKVIKDAGIQSQ